MKTIIALIALTLSLSSMASSGSKILSVVLEQSEVETLEADMLKKGFTLSNVQDVFATRGVSPRCPCSSFDLTFSRPNAGKTEVKSFNVYSQGFGTSPEVTIKASK